MQYRRVTLPILFMAMLSSLGLIQGCREEPPADLISPWKGTITESFSEPARTRLGRTYPVTMPIEGRIDRIDLEPGDPVAENQILVQFDQVPYEQAAVEARSAVQELEASLRLNAYDAIEKTLLVETQTTIEATEEALKAAAAQVQAQQARYERAKKELERTRQLAADDTVAQSELDDAQLEAETALISLRQEQFNLAAFRAIFTVVKLGPEYVREWLDRKALQREELLERLAQARARLVRAEHDLALAVVRSPIDGVVLEKYEQGGGPQPAGQPLLLLGNLDDLEVIADVLSQDALKLTSGTQVILEAADVIDPIEGWVKKIEPAGFTKLSSLGVEQQRVNVIIGIQTVPGNLGAGYRLQARFQTAQRKDVLMVPRHSVLQAPDGSYYVYLMEKGHPARRPVRLGLQNDSHVEIIDGLSEQNQIVESPDTLTPDK